uniref:C2H2-type domain-containing protein n=1 Tax=Glossina morsitans morsitans TaxID=37546 RepID=A0A1B0FM85_GLOMM
MDIDNNTVTIEEILVEQKIAERILELLHGVETPEDKLRLLLGKCVEAERKNQFLERTLKAQANNFEGMMREHNKILEIKDKVIKMCRDQQILVTSIKSECMRKLEEVDDKRWESQLRFERSLKEITEALNKNNEENQTLRNRDIEMTKTIKALAEQYHASQQELQELNDEIQFISQSDKIGLSAIPTDGDFTSITEIGHQKSVKDEFVINNLEVIEEACASNELLMNNYSSLEAADVANTETEFLMGCYNVATAEETCAEADLLNNFTETIVKEEPKIKGVSISARKRKRDEDSKVSNSKIKARNVELPDGRFKCLPCDKIFSSRCYLKQHNKIYHFGAVPYRCEECGKRFPTEAILNAHLTRHGSDAKPHKRNRQIIMTSQTQGIQQLLAAEKKAAEKVAEARKRKARRLKQAKEEATEEIEKYRQERERQFKEFEAKHMGSREDVAAKIRADTQVKLSQMEKAIANRKDPVIKEILQYIYQIEPEKHRNYQRNCTFHFFHLLICWHYNSSFPSNISWWLVNAITTTIMCIGGEFLCLKSELKEIPVGYSALNQKSDV